jgi:repressor LexA
MSESLTRRQRAILEHLRSHADRQAHPPTLDELCRALGLRSRGSMHKHIQALVAAGYVEPMSGKQRGIRLRADDADPLATLPLLGRIAAGRPIEALENPEALEVPNRLRGRR